MFEEEKEGGLFLRQIGLDRTELLSSSVKLPEGFDPPFAQSLNHAFTVLSERYETHRLSHTGNVLHEHVLPGKQRSLVSAGPAS